MSYFKAFKKILIVQLTFLNFDYWGGEKKNPKFLHVPPGDCTRTAVWKALFRPAVMHYFYFNLGF